MNKNISRILWGLCILLFGVGMILYAIGVIQDLLFDGWWTIFLIIPGTAMLFQRGCRTGGSVLVLLGVYFLLREQQVIHFRLSWPLILGIILIYAGVVLLFGWLFHPKARKENTRSSIPFQNGSVDFNDFPSYQAVFSGFEVNNASKALRGAKGNGVFGSLKMDFTGAQLTGDSQIELHAVFGEVQIRVPQNVRLLVNAAPVFGSVENHAVRQEDANLPQLIVDATAVFGSVKIF